MQSEEKRELSVDDVAPITSGTFRGPWSTDTLTEYSQAGMGPQSLTD